MDSWLRGGGGWFLNLEFQKGEELLLASLLVHELSSQEIQALDIFKGVEFPNKLCDCTRRRGRGG